MMELQDILKIDREPFDEDLLNSLDYQYSPIYYQNILGSLIIHYFCQFAKEYHFELSLDKWTILIGRKMEEDDYPFWYETSEGLFFDSLEQLGWDYHLLSLDQSDLEYQMNDSKDLGTEGSKKKFLVCLEKWIDKRIQAPKAYKNIIMKQADTIYDATYYMDEGIIFIYWNDKLSEYLEFRKKSPELVEELCGREDKEIREIEGKIWFPFIRTFDYEKGEEEGLHYSMHMLGSDGATYCSLDEIDPNWICRAFVMNELLDLALSKLRLEEINLKQAV